MNGHVLEGTSIAVDYWKCSQKRYIHFLSHMHADHIIGLRASFRGLIYTSQFNAVMLNNMKVKQKCIQVLSLDEPHSLYDEDTDCYFMVTLIDANHCPGSVMFLFQGPFGNILYTADFRCDSDMLSNPILEMTVAENNGLDTLYLDNTYVAEHCEFPTRAEVLAQVIDLINEHPEHRILIGLHSLGKEEVLQAIALQFNEPILVSKERKVILDMLDINEATFSTKAEKCRIEVVNISTLSNRSIHQRREKDGPVLILALTALYEASRRDGTAPHKSGRLNGVIFLPYSDHSPHSELKSFVAQMRPKKILPIVVSKRNRVHNFQFDVSANNVIPPSIMMLENCGSQELFRDLPPARNIEKHMRQAEGEGAVTPAVSDSVSAIVSLSLDLQSLEPSTNAVKEKQLDNCSSEHQEMEKDKQKQIESHKSSNMSLILVNIKDQFGTNEKHKKMTVNAQTYFNTGPASDSATIGMRHCINNRSTAARGNPDSDSSETEKRIDSEELCWGTACNQQNFHFDTDVNHDKVIVGCDSEGVKTTKDNYDLPCLDLSQPEERNHSEELRCVTASPNTQNNIAVDTVTNQDKMMVDDGVSNHLEISSRAHFTHLSDSSKTENKIDSGELCWGTALSNIPCHDLINKNANQEEMAGVLPKDLKPIASPRDVPYSYSFQMSKRYNPEDLCCDTAVPKTGTAQNNNSTALEPTMTPFARDVDPKLFFWSHINARELFASSVFQRL